MPSLSIVSFATFRPSSLTIDRIRSRSSALARARSRSPDFLLGFTAELRGRQHFFTINATYSTAFAGGGMSAYRELRQHD